MQEWLSNPAFQGGIAPFAVGLVLSLLLLRAGALQGVALLAGFLLTTALTVGLGWEPLTSTRKIVLMVILIAVFSLFVSWLKGTGKGEGLLTGLVLAGLTWVLWPYLARLTLMDNLVVLGSIVAFAVWTVIMTALLRNKSRLSSGTAIGAMAIGLGACAVIGASALYGQMAMSIGAAALGYVLAQIIGNSSNAQSGWVLTAIGGGAIAIMGPASAIYAQVPWMSLLALAAIPLLAQFDFSGKIPALKRTLLLFVVYMIPAGGAIWLTYRAAGPVPF
ncbi:MAG: hypothetical protein OEW58_01535 [Gammaproteobacteria bacterium]|nr:hypothetical protein [Gammaproteobacteria bacterium]